MGQMYICQRWIRCGLSIGQVLLGHLCSVCFGVCVCVYFVVACVVDATSALIHCGIPSCVQSTSYPILSLVISCQDFLLV